MLFRSHIESRNTGSSEKASGKKDNKNTSNSNNNNCNQSQSQSSNSRNSTSSAPNKGSSSKDKPKNSISDKLEKNGKLIGEEREHCLKEGLCLYCSEKGHIAQDCPKSMNIEVCCYINFFQPIVKCFHPLPLLTQQQ